MSNRPGAVRHHRRMAGLTQAYVQASRDMASFNRRWGSRSDNTLPAWRAWLQKNKRRDRRREWRQKEESP